MKEFPYKTSFAKLVIKPLVSEERDKYLSLASLDEVAKFIPNIDTAKNHDLLPVAFNACVVNRVNKNTDVIDTQTALAMYKNFVNKPINVEHHRQKVIGIILASGFSAFGSDKPLTPEEVAKMDGPFNITLGGVIWRLVAPELSDLIEEASDPTSPNYMEVSASWELGFTGYRIALLEGGKKNLSEAKKIIDDPKEIETAQNKLIALGGDGKFEDLFAYRMPSYEVLPLGVGFTEKPAAEVKGVAVAKQPEVGSTTEPAVGQPPTKEAVKSTPLPVSTTKEEVGQTNPPAFAEVSDEKNSNKISQTLETNVKQERITSMKINSITDISEASVKDVTPTALASAVADFIQSSLTEKSKEYEKQKGELNTKVVSAETVATEAKAELTKVQAKVTELAAQVETFAKEKAEREKVDKFNTRMTQVTDVYEFDDEARAAVVEEVKAIGADEEFTKYLAKAKVLYKGYAKKAAEKAKAEDDNDADDAEAKKAKAKKEAKASVEAVVENAEDKTKGGLPNGSTATQTLLDKAKLAFAKENVIVSR